MGWWESTLQWEYEIGGPEDIMCKKTIIKEWNRECPIYRCTLKDITKKTEGTDSRMG